MGLLRSEAMKYGMLVVPGQPAEAHKYMELIGTKTKMELEDMNTRDTRRPFAKHVQRINEMERILRFLFSEIAKVPGLQITQYKTEEFLNSAYQLDDVEQRLQKQYKDFIRFKDFNEQLVESRNKVFEEKKILEVAMKMLGKAAAVDRQNSAMKLEESNLKTPLVGDERPSLTSQLSGVVANADLQRFSRALWRASRGNTWTRFDGIDEVEFDAKTGEPAPPKSVFVVYFQSSQSNSAMSQRLLKVCQAFQTNLYAWPENAAIASKKFFQLANELKDKDKAIEGFQEQVRTDCADFVAPANPGSNSLIEDYRLFCIKEKAIYTQLNLCAGESLLRCHVWYPAKDEQEIQKTLSDASKNQAQGASLVPDRDLPRTKPPTYIRVNDFTAPWQDVVNTYGIPKYQEANPALLTVITFPFIFGMMYGDVGHGSMLLCVGIFLILKGKDLKNSVPAAYDARYMVFQLGLFATFSGFMYNDFFSIGLQIFPSGFDAKPADAAGTVEFTPNAAFEAKGPYVFGLDWAWAGATNELLYLNSLKMKMSVLFGVLQMTVGVLLKWSNAIFEKNLVDFIFECIPQMIFMLCFFGWMDFMILYKWTHTIDSPPSIINSLICMAMGGEDDNPIYAGSVELSKKLMMATMCSVPLMLFPKPFILLAQHNATKKADTQLMDVETSNEVPVAAGHGDHDGHGGEFEFGEVFIHQIIETIEYVLGTVSHTASYLRIWALSLAHQQLSLVFFQKTLTMGLEMSYPMNGIALYFMFGAWFGVTVGVLLGMDVLECFLHTLRLHWVEFQSKFYKAEGNLFNPFDIPGLVAAPEDDKPSGGS